MIQGTGAFSAEKSTIVPNPRFAHKQCPSYKNETLLRTNVPWVPEIKDLLEIQDGAVKIMSSNYFFYTVHQNPNKNFAVQIII